MLNNGTLNGSRTWLLVRTWHCYFISFNSEHPIWGAHSVSGGKYSSYYDRMPSRTSLADRKNIAFIVVINYEENNSQIWSRYSIFLLSIHNGIFDGTLTAGAIGGKPYWKFSNPVASALKPFSNPPSYCVFFICIIHWVPEPAPLDEDHDISFFTGKWELVLFGHNNAQHNILGIHNYSIIVVKVTIKLAGWSRTNILFFAKKFRFRCENILFIF